MNASESSRSSAAAGVRAFYPGIVSARFYETWDFYTECLGFRTVCEWDHYVHLVHPSGAQLNVLKEEIEEEISQLVSATDARGFWINLEVTDADREYARLQAAGVPIAFPLEDKPWGDRQFGVRDPNGILIFIAHRLPQAERTCADIAAAVG